MIFSNDSKSFRYGGLNPYGLDGERGARADQDLAKKRRRNTPRTGGVRRDSLVLNDTDPGGLLTITRTQPDIVRCGETDFDGEMDPSSQPMCVLQFEELP